MSGLKLPIGIVNFEELRTPDEDGNSYVYVDKTEYIQKLAKGVKFNFFSRPRRFGKSLLVSTLYHLFSGNRELFRGLWIDKDDRWNWGVKYPVIRIDFNEVIELDTELPQSLAQYMDDEAARYGIALPEANATRKFKELLNKLYQKTGQKVVLLIDEYDKPITDHLEANKRKQADINREHLRKFFTPLKSNDAPLHFMLVTGVSKFGKLSLFSGLNNLTDQTISRDFPALLGYTHEELNHYFEPWIKAWSEEEHLDVEELNELLRKWYDGYSWNGADFMYTPWSILHALKERDVRGYWSSTGESKMLLDLLKEKQVTPNLLEGQWVDADVQDKTHIEAISPLALFWQTGYLTIKEARKENARSEYRLGMPNREVRESFLLDYL